MQQVIELGKLKTKVPGLIHREKCRFTSGRPGQEGEQIFWEAQSASWSEQGREAPVGEGDYCD